MVSGLSYCLLEVNQWIIWNTNGENSFSATCSTSQPSCSITGNILWYSLFIVVCTIIMTHGYHGLHHYDVIWHNYDIIMMSYDIILTLSRATGWAALPSITNTMAWSSSHAAIYNIVKCVTLWWCTNGYLSLPVIRWCCQLTTMRKEWIY